MENLEKEEKKRVGAQPSKAKVHTRQGLLQVIQTRSNASARKALEVLVKKGCDQNRIIQLVYSYCRGASPDEAKAAVKAGGESLKRWEALCETLREDADQIERILDELDKMGIATGYYPANQHPAEAIREFADHLATLCRSLKPGVNLKSGSTETLVFLCYLVKACTGKEHYPQIAALIRPFQQSEKHVDQGADAIRNRVARYEKEHAITLRRRIRIPLRQEAEAEVAEWPKTSRRKKKSPRSRRKTKTL